MDDAVDAALEELGLPRQAAAQARPARAAAAVADDDDIAAQRDAAAQLGMALRALTDASVRTLASTATLLDVVARITQCLPALTAEQRDVGEPAPLDDPAAKLWLYNPVVGQANPIAPWLETTLVDGVLTGRATLGLPYQGPRGYLHGGVSAMMLDQVLGDVVSASGRSGLTVSLSARYRRPVPLLAPLLVVGRVVEVADRKITAAGTIALASEPDQPLVEGVGIFVVPRPDQAARLFGAFRGPAPDTPGAPHPADAAGTVPAGTVPSNPPSTT
ncbi:PaaI family thioesterase [Frankia sp. AiPs1]|uniref:PaaI family thioesterase n=1 Tax=Frankia sp. AiPs1 TaxID=573493 RepID=UPI002043D50C|nr:PaaI family thioesterase [Frankia sp. AiPs1]MCM3922638.1 PaaI family thioesterase [Frankia sp. AiPs1]